MSDNPQVQADSGSRAQRTILSCTECRRRKQKCSQEQPCFNCARRYPQPLCTYIGGPVRHREPGQLPPFASESVPRPILQPLPLVFLPSPAGPANWQHAHLNTPNLMARPTPWTGTVVVRPPRSTSLPWLKSEPWSLSLSSTLALPVESPCPDDCEIHSAYEHEALEVLRTRDSLPPKWPEEWTTEDAAPHLLTNSPLSFSLQYITHLSIPPSKQNVELMHTFITHVSRLKASMDGRPDPSNLYLRDYVSFAVQAPLLAQIGLYTAACVLSETSHLDYSIAISHKGVAFHMLAAALTSPASDVTIAAVTQLILDEWYWGQTITLQAHLRALREMIHSQGGLDILGLNGMLSGLVTVCDRSIALCSETAPYLLHQPYISFAQSPTQAAYSLACNTPLIPDLIHFKGCAIPLGLHSATAQILDDIRFLLQLIMYMGDGPSDYELQKIHSTSIWVHDKITAMSPDIPYTPSSEIVPPPAGYFSPGFAPPSAPVSYSRRSSAQSVVSAIAHSTQRLSHSPHSRPPLPLHQASSQDSVTSNASGSSNYFAATPLHPTTSPPPPPPLSPAPPPQPQPQATDGVYRAIRLGALIYARAIMERKPFSTCISTERCLQLWTACWRVPLATWRPLIGVYAWLMICVAPSARATKHERFVKQMLTCGLVQMGFEHWEVADRGSQAALRLQAWLAGGGEGGGGDRGDGDGDGDGGKSAVDGDGGGDGDGDEERGGNGGEGGGVDDGDGDGDDSEDDDDDESDDCESAGQKLRQSKGKEVIQ